mgnify:CR=1 FL=1
MKKVMLVLAVILGFAASANAQTDSKMAAGINLNLGLGDSYTNYGIGAKYQYAFTDHWRGEADFNYFFKKDHTSFWDIDLNAQYLFHLGNGGVNLYPLAGLGFYNNKFDGWGGSVSDNSLGVNYGVGVEFPLCDSFKLNAEFKGQSGFSSGWGTRWILSVGAAYCF